jgi:hypothetical protein
MEAPQASTGNLGSWIRVAHRCELTSNGVTFEQYDGVLESGLITEPTREGARPAPAAAKSPGSRIPTGTSFRSRVIARTLQSSGGLEPLSPLACATPSRMSCDSDRSPAMPTVFHRTRKADLGRSLISAIPLESC